MFVSVYTRPLGGVSPAHILDIDLLERQTLVPGSPAASRGPGDREEEVVSINPAELCEGLSDILHVPEA